MNRNYLAIVAPLTPGEHRALRDAIRHGRPYASDTATHARMEVKAEEPSYIYSRPETASVRLSAKELDRLIRAGRVGAWGGKVLLARLVEARAEMAEKRQKTNAKRTTAREDASCNHYWRGGLTRKLIG